jgi:hypothetical protein
MNVNSGNLNTFEMKLEQYKFSEGLISTLWDMICTKKTEK